MGKLKAVHTFGRNSGVIFEAEGIVGDGDIFFNKGIFRFVACSGLDGNDRFCTVDKGIVFNAHIANSARFEPTIGIAFNQNGRHKGVDKSGVFDNDGFHGSNEESAGRTHFDFTRIDGYLGIP